MYRTPNNAHNTQYKSRTSNAIILNATFKRTDLNPTNHELETIWVKIINTKTKNIICCCDYRHPSFNPVRFKEHLELTLSQLTRESNTIFIMGDYEKNCESHPESNDFLLMPNSYFLLPYILHTRITERSATPIDNIFANT